MESRNWVKNPSQWHVWTVLVVYGLSMAMLFFASDFFSNLNLMLVFMIVSATWVVGTVCVNYRKSR